ncbi:MAG: L-fucose/L-arabinose isomerase family protein [Pirellulales bacterium]|nr:L-fucose/L-arabinose isomerase family protein [Pirellulales bacterium]
MKTALVQPRNCRKPRVGLFGIGHPSYWEQFPGMLPRLQGYQRVVSNRLAELAEVIDAGMVDDAHKAVKAGERFARERVELVVCYVGTYAMSNCVLPLVQRANAPTLILNLQPISGLDYKTTDTGDWLANCTACCVPEISNVFARSRIDFNLVTGVLGVDGGRCGEATPKHPEAVQAWSHIRQWVSAAGAVGQLRDSRIGFLGHTYPGMLDMQSDITQLSSQLGTQIETLEMCDLAQRLPAAGEQIVHAKRDEVLSIYDISEDSPVDRLARKPKDAEFEWACRCSVAMDRLVADFDLQGLSYYYRGLDDNQYERIGAGLILGNSLLCGRGIPCSGEGDLKNCHAMKIMDLLGHGGSFAEICALDYNDHFILMGHDGPFHLGIAEGRPILRGLDLYHGKHGYGIGVEARVKYGPVTLLALTQTADGRLKFLVSRGESVPGATLEIGNTDTRVKFECGVTNWVNRWCAAAPTHHFALGMGDAVAAIRAVTSMLRLELCEVA